LKHPGEKQDVHIIQGVSKRMDSTSFCHSALREKLIFSVFSVAKPTKLGTSIIHWQ
jgi:hypothetical protein